MDIEILCYANLKTLIFPENINYPSNDLFGRTNIKELYVCSDKAVPTSQNDMFLSGKIENIYVRSTYNAQTFMNRTVNVMKDDWICYEPHFKIQYLTCRILNRQQINMMYYLVFILLE